MLERRKLAARDMDRQPSFIVADLKSLWKSLNDLSRRFYTTGMRCRSSAVKQRRTSSVAPLKHMVGRPINGHELNLIAIFLNHIVDWELARFVTYSKTLRMDVNQTIQELRTVDVLAPSVQRESTLAVLNGKFFRVMLNAVANHVFEILVATESMQPEATVLVGPSQAGRIEINQGRDRVVRNKNASALPRELRPSLSFRSSARGSAAAKHSMSSLVAIELAQIWWSG